MASRKRSVRSVRSRAVEIFDDQFWPVFVALIVLGAFLTGIVLAGQKFNDPRLYANAGVTLGLIALLITTLSIVAYSIGNRFVRRSVQLAIVVCLIVHLALVQTLVRFSFSSPGTWVKRQATATAKKSQKRPARHVSKVREKQQLEQDLNRPVETPEPVATADDDPQQRVQQSATQFEPQPVDTAKATKSSPEMVRRQKDQTQAAAVRQANALSKHSRQQKTLELAQAQPAAAAASQERQSPTPMRPTQSASKAATASAARPTQSVETRQVATRQSTRSSNPTQPTVNDSQRSRRNSTRRPVEPVKVAARATPAAAAAASSTAAVQPKTLPRQQPTAQPMRRSVVATQVEPQESNPRRQVAAQPNLNPAALNPAAINPARARTSRPNSTVQPMVAKASPASSPTVAEVKSPKPTSPNRLSTQVAVERVLPAPSTPSENQVARNSLRASNRTPQPEVENTGRPLRSRTNTGVGAIANPIALQEQPRRSRQSATNPAAAATSVVRAATSNRLQRRSPRPETGPAVSSNASPTRRRTQSRVTEPTRSQVVRNSGRIRNSGQVAKVTSRPNVRTAGDTGTASQLALRPTRNEVGRSATRSNSQTRSPATMNTPTASGSPQIAASRVQAKNTLTPTINPTVVAGTQPARATKQLATTASPVAVESPAANSRLVANQQPSARANPTALSRAETGTAGTGRSANLNIGDSAPAESTAELASGMARRQASSQPNPGDQLVSQQANARARSTSSARAPAVDRMAQVAAAADVAGARQMSPLSASGSMVSRQSRANDPTGAVAATRGNLDQDIGATQTVAGRGQRADGGGRPIVDMGESVAQRRRSAGSATMPAIASAQVGPVSATTAESGGAPLTPQATRSLVGRSGGPDSPQASGRQAAGDPAAAAELAGDLLAQPGKRADRTAALADLGESGEADTAPRRDRSGGRLAGGNAVAQAGEATLTPLPSAVSPAGARSAADPSSAGIAAGSAAVPRATEPNSSSLPGRLAGDAAPAAISGPATGTDIGAGIAANSERRASTAVPQVSLAGDSDGGRRRPSAARMQGTGQAVAMSPAAINPQAMSSGGGTEGPSATLAGDSTQPPANGAAVARASTSDMGRSATRGDLASSGQTVDMQRTADQGGAASPQLTDMATGIGGQPGRRNPTANKSVGAVAQAAPASPVGGSAGDETMGQIAGGQVSPMRTDAGQGASRGPLRDVDVAAAVGPGGLGRRATSDVGILRPVLDGDDIGLASGRFRRVSATRNPTTSVGAAKAYQGRAERLRGQQDGGLGPQTERAIELGLEFLARNQQADGRWRLSGFAGDAAPLLDSDAAATGLAVLAFQGAGYSHKKYKYRQLLAKAHKFLLANQASSGLIFADPALRNEKIRLFRNSIAVYTHSICALALCEAYGMTQDPELKIPAQKALDFILDTQHPTLGGWRYEATRNEADTSVTGWMMMALKSGQLAGLRVPQQSMASIQKWLDRARDPDRPFLYCYNPNALDVERQQRQPTKQMTSVALLMRLYLGWDRDHPDMVRGTTYLTTQMPDSSKPDTYYWYYATQLMFHMGGEKWQKWNNNLHQTLVQSQLARPDNTHVGSWDPGPYKWGSAAGRLYVTTMNLLSLEVNYRHLPLYVDTGKGNALDMPGWIPLAPLPGVMWWHWPKPAEPVSQAKN